LQRFLTLSWSRSRDRLIEHRVDLRFVEAAGAPPEKGIATLLSGLGTGGGGNGGNSDALACWGGPSFKAASFTELHPARPNAKPKLPAITAPNYCRPSSWPPL
jgi:hypothetical protein